MILPPDERRAPGQIRSTHNRSVHESAEMYITVCNISMQLIECAMRSITVVASHKRIAVCPPLDPVDVLLRLLQRDVHVAVHGLKLP